MAFLYSVFGPFLVWPIEYFLPYPYIIEELFKCVVVWFGEKNAKTYIYAGLAFAFTETVLYSIGINAFGRISYIAVRLITSGILHTVTFLIIYFSAKKDKRFISTGFLTAALIHYLYNIYIPTY